MKEIRLNLIQKINKQITHNLMVRLQLATATKIRKVGRNGKEETGSNLPVVGLLAIWSSVLEAAPENSIWPEIAHQTWQKKAATAQLHGSPTH